MTPKCLITGVVLLIADSAHHADLFKLGDVYIINANEYDDGASYATVYERSRTMRTGVKFIRIKTTIHDDYFERRNVFVAHEDDVEFSVEALEYMEKS